tara:strand:- start:325 stop:678 length:354 start_codon:yes stop_codon:yes gene_type:complete
MPNKKKEKFKERGYKTVNFYGPDGRVIKQKRKKIGSTSKDILIGPDISPPVIKNIPGESDSDYRNRALEVYKNYLSNRTPSKLIRKRGFLGLKKLKETTYKKGGVVMGEYSFKNQHD